MCTVTFLPLGESEFILTSSRDVLFARKKALPPKKYIEDSVELTYPKDGEAGGSWIGLSSKKRLICLLNGGYTDHIVKEPYKMSRGLIVKELLKGDNIHKTLKTINLSGIEPFTLVIVDWNNGLELLDFVWTGDKKHLFSMPKTPHIWSSSTLYNEAAKKLREKWFMEWQNGRKIFNQKEILNFHKTAGDGNSETNVLMKREKGGTVSITSIIKSSENIQINYEDVISNKVTKI